MRFFFGFVVVILLAAAAYSLFRESGERPTVSPAKDDTARETSVGNAPDPLPNPPDANSAPAISPQRSELAAADGGIAKLGANDLPRAEGARIEGRVIDRSGQPMRGATVRLIGSDGAFLRVDRDLGLSMQSDSDGRFTFAEPPALLGLALEATAANFASLRRDIGTLSPGQIFGPVELILEPEITLRGTVKDSDGRPVPGVKIDVALGEPQPGQLAAKLASVTTNERGAYEVRGLQRVLYRLVAEKAGYVPVEQQKTLFAVTLKPEATLDFVLETASGTVHGRVLDDRDQPIADAVVSAVADRHVVRATSSGSGEFELTGLGNAAYRASAEGRGFHAAAALPVRSGDADVVLRVARNGSLLGRLALAGGGAPASAAVDVLLRDRESGRFGMVTRATVENARFRAEDLAPGYYQLVITSLEACRKESDVFEVASGQPTDAGVIELRSGGVVSGRITASGGASQGTVALLIGDLDAANPAAQGAALYSEETPKARYRAGSSFRLEHVAPGDYSLLVMPEKGAIRTLRGIQVENARTTTLDDLTIGAGGQVFGRVIDVQGVSIVRATVRATHENGTVALRTSDGAGYFSFPDLEPGQVTVTLDASAEIRGSARPAAARVTAGGATEIELRVRPEGP